MHLVGYYKVLVFNVVNACFRVHVAYCQRIVTVHMIYIYIYIYICIHMYIQTFYYSHIVKVNFVFVRRIYCMFL